MAVTPSLKALQAFEVAARTGSFAAAAMELSVSPAAVSQLIRGLEAQVERRLFHRINRQVVLTEAGLEIQPRLAAAFEELRGVARHLSGSGPRPRLTVSVPPSLATGWICDRISGFVQEHGPFDISVRGEDDPVAFDRDLIDIRMSFGRVHYDPRDAREILTDSVYALCAPSFARQWGLSERAERLADAPLIHTDWGRAAATFPSWGSWFENAGLSPGPNAERGMVANSSHVAIRLAGSGLGLVLVQGLLATAPLEDGSLVLASPFRLRLSQPYVLTSPGRRAPRPVFEVFSRWLEAEIEKTVSAHALSAPALRGA